MNINILAISATAVLLLCFCNSCTWIDKTEEEQKLQPIIQFAKSKTWKPFQEIKYERGGYSRAISSIELSGNIASSNMYFRSESLSFHSSDGLDTCDNQLFLDFGEYSLSYNYFRDSGFFLWNTIRPKKRYVLVARGNVIEILYRQEVTTMWGWGGYVEYKGIRFR